MGYEPEMEMVEIVSNTIDTFDDDTILILIHIMVSGVIVYKSPVGENGLINLEHTTRHAAEIIGRVTKTRRYESYIAKYIAEIGDFDKMPAEYQYKIEQLIKLLEGHDRVEYILL